ncbi:hypothetical protein [Aquibacillus salsiterrae]|uniref:Uncharacterized protein n=1 Tax=Aquibacillus salsiterrae TaxID=2950439 RepID=A0A9X4AFT0_9BACI|nr:hypothetical protein [Aquibacillus salsiterrae]MDC3418342.1 hypothetical protein [Aquibacillus salsiterrae]
MRHFKTLIILIFLITLTVGCSNEQQVIEETSNEKLTGTVGGFYKSYSDVDELAEKADLVIEGKVLGSRVEVLDMTKEPENPTEENAPGEVQQIERIYTISKVEVTKVYKGEVEKQEIIEVKQIGGETENAILIPEEGAYLKENKKVVLFLESYEDSPASLLNPIQAQYTIEGNKIVKLKDNNLKLELKDLKKYENN